ncbi:hypothetical protein Bhyg_10403 [Pseudolycoriella hygida]|uniref:Uncharacterized protein n=1 Tax=Pseudolycoriella hygida TaxID=35572 RepID=A0A9Q0MTG1_9DIPT|nr:hypothetical protein Bhyg_10403 [Pseudolycoriella hygida]
MDDDILDIDEVLTDSFYMPSEECYNDIQNIVQQWKNNENAPVPVSNECTKYFDTRTFTRQKKRLNSTSNGLSDLDYQKSVGFPVENTSGRNFILDSSPSNSLCSYMSDDATSLITSGDFSNVSYFINNANDLTLQFNDLDLKKMDDTRGSSSTDTSLNSTAKRTITHNDLLCNTTIIENADAPGDGIVSPNDVLNSTRTIPTTNRTFEKESNMNMTFDKSLDDTFQELSGKIAKLDLLVPHVPDKYDSANLVQSTPKYTRYQISRQSASPPNLSPISSKKFAFGKMAPENQNTFMTNMPLDLDESITNEEQKSSLVNFEEFEKSIFLDDDKGDEDFETLLDRMGNSKRLEKREVMKESLDNIKKRHSLLNLEIKQEQQREKMNSHNGSSLHKSIPDERLLKRSRLFDDITITTSPDKIDRNTTTTVIVDSNRTFNNQSSQRNGSNQQLSNNEKEEFNSTVVVEKSQKASELPSEEMSRETEIEKPEKYDNRDRFKTIRLFKKPALNAVVITDAQTHFIEPAPVKTTAAQKHIEPISKLKSRQISTLSSRDSYLKSSSVENLNTERFKVDINVAKSSSTQSLDKANSMPKTSSLLRDRISATPKNTKPNNIQNVIQKSIPVFNSRTNVNKLSGLVRPSSGYYSYNTEAEKFEAVNNAQPSGDATFVNGHTVSNEPKQQPSRIAKPSGLRPPSKISCLPRPMSKR